MPADPLPPESPEVTFALGGFPGALCLGDHQLGNCERTFAEVLRAYHPELTPES